MNLPPKFKIFFPLIIKDDFSDLEEEGGEDTTNAKLIDVSHWQGIVDYSSVCRSGVRGVYIKASEGMNYSPGAFEDNTFKTHMYESGRFGLLRGAYHFARPQYDVNRQVAYFAPRTVACELPPALDLETDGGLPVDKLLVWVETFVNGLKARTGRSVVVLYTNGHFCQILPRVAKDVHLWLSQPLKGGETNPALSPSLPRGWTDWKMFQYSWKGRVPGVPVAVDLDWFNGDIPDLERYAQAY